MAHLGWVACPINFTSLEFADTILPFLLFSLSPLMLTFHCLSLLSRIISEPVLLFVDILPWVLPNWGVAGCGHGEQQRGGAAPHQAGQVPAAPARELRAFPQVRLLW